MSRGGRGGRGGGRGGGFGRGQPLPMGLTFADLENLPNDEAEMYPTMDPMPVLTSYTSEETRISQLQIGFAQRIRQSAYYITEAKKSDDLPRYSDKYRPSFATQPKLKRKELHQPFFPSEIYEGYFNPRKKKKAEKKPSKRLNLDELGEDVEQEDQDISTEEKSDLGSQAPDSDYDVEEEYDNDYAENYFDNGEEDNFDDLGGGVGDEGGGGGDE